MPDPFTGATLWSVPTHDQERVARMFPGATGHPGAAPLDATTRVLTLTIHDRLTAADLDEATSLEAVITRSDGFDHLPLPELQRRGIQVYHLAGYATESVAQWTITLLGATLGNLPEALQTTQDGAWRRDHLVGRRLSEVTVGVVGTGRIGRRVVGLLQTMGTAQVLGYDVDPDPDIDGPRFQYQETLEGLLAASDAVTLHVPLTDRTRGMLGAKTLAHMRPGAVLVNTARGAVVDTDAALAALESGALAGYAADVMPGEPDPPGLAALAGHPRTMVTPHLGAHSDATLDERYRITARIAAAVLDGDVGAVASYRVDPT